MAELTHRHQPLHLPYVTCFSPHCIPAIPSAYVIDVRERAIDIPPQSAITRDNVSVEVSGNLFVRFVDAEKAAYGARNPLYSVMQHGKLNFFLMFDVSFLIGMY